MQFPLSISSFIDAVPIKRITFSLADDAAMSRTRGGDVIRHRRGARLWGGEFEIDIDHHDVQAGADALLARLQEPDASFLLYDLRKPYPVSDPTGSIAGSTVRISGLSSDGWRVAIKGLPAGYVLTRGDAIAFTYGTNPVRRAYHRLVAGGVADAQGNIGGAGLEVVPAIRPGAQVEAVLTLARPTLKARLLEADYGSGKAIISEGGTARWVQSLR